MSVSTHVLTYFTNPAIIVAAAHSVRPVFRSLLLYRAGSYALKHGSEDERREAGLKIIDALTSDDEPWYRALMPWRKPDDS